MASTGFYLEVDTSDLNKTFNRLKSVMTEQQFTNAMHGIFNRTGSHVKAILKKDLPQKYEVKPGEIGKAVKKGRVTTSGLGVGCCIPISAPRRSIGGGFSASGGAHGWNSLKRRYRVKSRIVKSGQSTLPQNMSAYGGLPPFRNLGSRLGGLTFTREGKERLPIRKVSGIAIAQMPLNRSEAEVQKDIKDFLEKQMEQRFNYLLMSRK